MNVLNVHSAPLTWREYLPIDFVCKLVDRDSNPLRSVWKNIFFHFFPRHCSIVCVIFRCTGNVWWHQLNGKLQAEGEDAQLCNGRFAVRAVRGTSAGLLAVGLIPPSLIPMLAFPSSIINVLLY